MTQKEFSRFFKEYMGEDKTFKQAEKDIKGFMEALQKVFTETDEKKVIIPGFGTFVLQDRKQKRIRHPKTHEIIVIPEHKKVTFKTTSSFNSKINK